MDRKILWGGLALALVVAAFIWIKQEEKLVDLGLKQPGNLLATATPAAGVKTAAKAKATPKPTATLSYTDALKKYGDYRIQFSDKCEAYPGSVTYKNGTTVLLDNRANKAQTITLDGKSYSLGAYGYQVVTLSSNSLPHYIRVDCGRSVNIMNLLLQAKISQ